MSESALLLQSVLKAEQVDRKFLSLLSACNEEQILVYKAQNKFRDVITAVNSRLNVPEQRSAGIQLLKYFLTQCSDAIFIENGVTWMLLCMKGAEMTSVRDEAYDTLGMLLEMSHNFQELTKPVTAKVIPKLLEHLLNFCKSRPALQCFQAILHHYPGPCKKKSKDILTTLLSFVDEEDQELVESAGQCMCYLASVSTNQDKDVDKWTHLLTTFCATANSVMYQLFENVHEFNTPSVLTKLSAGFDLKPVKSSDPFVAIHMTANRLKNILTFIEGMLRGKLHGMKGIRADLLVALAYRGLSINCNMVSQGHSMEHVALRSVLTDIHVALLRLLQTFISCCPGGLLKFGPLFCKIVVQTLRWTSVSSKYGMERPYRHLREAAYNLLESWIIRAKGGSCAELMGNELVTMILQDTHQKRESVSLQVKKAKGAGNQVSANQQMYEERVRLSNPKANAGPCEAALRVLCALLLTSGSLLKQSLHVKLQETAISLLLEVRSASGPEDMPAPYSAITCRLQLYRLLSVLTIHPHPQWSPPTQFALSLLQWGQHDESLKVVEFCSMAMSCIRQMVHPSRSSPQFPMTVAEMRLSAGLPALPQVQVLRKEYSFENVNGGEIMEADTVSMETSTHENSQSKHVQVSGLSDSVNTHDLLTPSKEYTAKEKSSTPLCEVSVNGMETTSRTPNSSKRKRKSLTPKNVLTNDKEETPIPCSGKSLKKKFSSQFIVEEFDISPKRKRNRLSGQDWEVTDVAANDEEISKRKKEMKFIEQSSTLEEKRKQGSPTVLPEEKKSRTLKGSDINGESNINFTQKENNIETYTKMNSTVTVKTIDGNVHTVSDNALDEEPVVELADSDESGTLNLQIDSDMESVEIEEITSETGGGIYITQKDRSESEILKKATTPTKISTTGSPERDAMHSVSDHKMEKPAGMEIVVESSDVDLEETAASTEEKNSARKVLVVDVEDTGPKEVPVTVSTDKTSVEDVKASTVSDREMEETNSGVEAVIESPDIALEEVAALNEEEGVTKSSYVEAVVEDGSAKEVSAEKSINKPFVRDVKDSTVSDREMEETNSGMEAVVESPDVALEETAASNEESMTKKVNVEEVEIGSGSDTADEDILKSFVDVIAPKSA